MELAGAPKKLTLPLPEEENTQDVATRNVNSQQDSLQNEKDQRPPDAVTDLNQSQRIKNDRTNRTHKNLQSQNSIQTAYIGGYSAQILHTHHSPSTKNIPSATQYTQPHLKIQYNKDLEDQNILSPHETTKGRNDRVKQMVKILNQSSRKSRLLVSSLTKNFKNDSPDHRAVETLNDSPLTKDMAATHMNPTIEEMTLTVQEKNGPQIKMNPIYLEQNPLNLTHEQLSQLHLDGSVLGEEDPFNHSPGGAYMGRHSKYYDPTNNLVVQRSGVGILQAKGNRARSNPRGPAADLLSGPQQKSHFFFNSAKRASIPYKKSSVSSVLKKKMLDKDFVGIQGQQTGQKIDRVPIISHANNQELPQILHNLESLIMSHYERRYHTSKRVSNASQIEDSDLVPPSKSSKEALENATHNQSIRVLESAENGRNPPGKVPIPLHGHASSQDHSSSEFTQQQHPAIAEGADYLGSNRLENIFSGSLSTQHQQSKSTIPFANQQQPSQPSASDLQKVSKPSIFMSPNGQPVNDTMIKYSSARIEQTDYSEEQEYRKQQYEHRLRNLKQHLKLYQNHRNAYKVLRSNESALNSLQSPLSKKSKVFRIPKDVRKKLQEESGKEESLTTQPSQFFGSQSANAKPVRLPKTLKGLSSTSMLHALVKSPGRRGGGTQNVSGLSALHPDNHSQLIGSKSGLQQYSDQQLYLTQIHGRNQIGTQSSLSQNLSPEALNTSISGAIAMNSTDPNQQAFNKIPSIQIFGKRPPNDIEIAEQNVTADSRTLSRLKLFDGPGSKESNKRGTASTCSIKEPHILYVFADKQRIENDTPAFKFDLQKLKSKNLLIDKAKDVQLNQTQQVAEMQTQVYQRAVEDLLKEVSLRIGPKSTDDVRASKSSKKLGMPSISAAPKEREFTSLFMLDGMRVKSIQDIPPDAKILIACEGEEMEGVEFEDLGQQKSQDFLKELLLKNKEKYNRMERPEPVDVKKSSELKFMTKIKKNKASFATRDFTRESFKLPQIQTLRDRLEEQQNIAEQVAGTPEEKSPPKKKSSDDEQEGLLVQSIIKRRDWIKKYKISEKILFELFSEFTSIMMLAKAKDHRDKALIEREKKLNKKKQNPNQAEFEKNMGEVLGGQGDRRIADLAKVSSESANQFKLAKEDLKNFRVPLDLFREYCKAIKSLNSELQDLILLSMGVDMPRKDEDDEDLPESIRIRRKTKLLQLEKLGLAANKLQPQISWDVFVRLNCILVFDVITKQEKIDFLIRLVDPESKGVLKQKEIDKVLNTLFSGGIKYKVDQINEQADKMRENLRKQLIGKLNQTNILRKKGLEILMKPKKEEVDETYKNVKGYSEDIKRDLISKGIFLPTGEFVVGKLKEGLESGLLDLNTFFQVLK